MNVTLLRHFQVDYLWRFFYTSDEFATAGHEYDLADIQRQSVTLPHRYSACFVSTSNRALRTLHLVLGSGIAFKATDLLKEVPIAPFIQTRLRLPTALWFLGARLQWTFSKSQQPETRNDSIARAISFVELIKATKTDSLVISHGLFLRVLSRQMIRAGFRGKKIGHLKNGEYQTYILREQIAEPGDSND